MPRTRSESYGYEGERCPSRLASGRRRRRGPPCRGPARHLAAPREARRGHAWAPRPRNARALERGERRRATARRAASGLDGGWSTSATLTANSGAGGAPVCFSGFRPDSTASGERPPRSPRTLARVQNPPRRMHSLFRQPSRQTRIPQQPRQILRSRLGCEPCSPAGILGPALTCIPRSTKEMRGIRCLAMGTLLPPAHFGLRGACQSSWALRQQDSIAHSARTSGCITSN
jgi:hypothetical protein